MRRGGQVSHAWARGRGQGERTYAEDHLADGVEDGEGAEGLAGVRLAARLHDAERERVHGGDEAGAERAERGRADEERLAVRGPRGRGRGGDEKVREEVDEERAADEGHVEAHLLCDLGRARLGGRGGLGGGRGLGFGLGLEREDDDWRSALVRRREAEAVRLTWEDEEQVQGTGEAHGRDVVSELHRMLACKTGWLRA